MAQGLGHHDGSDGRLFWLLAIPNYIGGVITCWYVVAIVRQILWLRRQARRSLASI